MLNYDLALVSAVVETRDITEALKHGARPELLGPEAAHLWDTVVTHYGRFHEVPSPDHLQTLCPTYVHQPPPMKVGALVHELKTRRLYRLVDSAVANIAQANHQDPWEARKLIQELTNVISTENQEGNTDLVAGDDRDEVFRVLDRLQTGGGLLGYRWPWEYLNSNTTGILPGQFLYVYGSEKSMKTFLLLFLALHFQRLGLRVLFCTREMGNSELSWRAYAMRCKLDIDAWNKGDLSTEALMRVDDAMGELAESRNLIFSGVTGGYEGLLAKIKETRPHIVLHDYLAALAEDLEMHGRRRKSRDDSYYMDAVNWTKQLAMSEQLPIIGCGHTNWKGEIAHSKHIARKADMALYVQTDKQKTKQGIVIRRARGMRENLGFTLSAKLCETFGEFMGTDISWIEGCSELDTAEQKAASNAPPPPPEFQPSNKKKSTFRAY